MHNEPYGVDTEAARYKALDPCEECGGNEVYRTDEYVDDGGPFYVCSNCGHGFGFETPE